MGRKRIIHKIKPKSKLWDVDSSWNSIDLIEQSIKEIKELDKIYNSKTEFYIHNSRKKWFTLYIKRKFLYLDFNNTNEIK